MIRLRFTAIFVLVLFMTREATAEYVPVSFRDNGAIIDAQGEVLHGARKARYYFTNVALGGVCGDKQAAFERGETMNNALGEGDVCFATAKLRRRSDRKLMTNQLVTVINEEGTVRASGRTNSQGKVVLNWTVLVGGGAPVFTLKGARLRAGKFLGCTVYAYDHNV